MLNRRSFLGGTIKGIGAFFVGGVVCIPKDLPGWEELGIPTYTEWNKFHEMMRDKVFCKFFPAKKVAYSMRSSEVEWLMNEYTLWKMKKARPKFMIAGKRFKVTEWKKYKQWIRDKIQRDFSWAFDDTVYQVRNRRK